MLICQVKASDSFSFRSVADGIVETSSPRELMGTCGFHSQLLGHYFWGSGELRRSRAKVLHSAKCNLNLRPRSRHDPAKFAAHISWEPRVIRDR